VDRVVGLDGVRNDIAMMRTPDGHGRLELMKFHTPPATTPEPNAPVNTLGIRRIMFAVEDIEDVLARLQAHGAELFGEVEQYEDSYRLCYVRGPEGIIIALASSSAEAFEAVTTPCGVGQCRARDAGDSTVHDLDAQPAIRLLTRKGAAFARPLLPDPSSE
jgi:hypothetical protein